LALAAASDGESDGQASALRERAELRQLRQQLREKNDRLAQLADIAELRLQRIRELELRLHQQGVQLEEARGSTAWKLLKPLRKAAQVAGGVVGAVEAKPLPHHQVSVHDDTWESWGNDPQCLLHNLGQVLYKGWYFIEMHARTDLLHADARFYFDYGDGYQEADAVPLPYRHGVVAKRLVWLRGRPRSVRLDPMDLPGRFAIDRLRFSRVAGPFAASRMLRRLEARHPVFEGQSAKLVRQRVMDAAGTRGERFVDRLYVLYGETFDPAQRHRMTYTAWLERYDWPEYQNIEALLAEQRAFVRRPRFSAVMTLREPALPLLRQALVSVTGQSYPDWELIAVVPEGLATAVAELLAGLAAREPRVRIVAAATGDSDAQATHRGLSAASGDYCFLIDDADELAPHALHALAKAVNAQPGAAILYADEDKIDEDGHRFDPWFKPDWNPDLVLAQHYVSRLAAFRTSLVAEVGGLREGYADAESYDLLLRCSERVSADTIVHLPKLLYRRRVREEAAATVEARLERTTASGLRALADHLARTGQRLEVGPGAAPATYRVRHPLPRSVPQVSLLVPTRDGLHVLKKCVDSILEKTTYRNYEILILDNQSCQPETLAWFATITRHPQVRILRYDHPFNYSAINNFGAREARGEILGLINNDVEVISPDWLTEMVSQACRPEIGCVGAKLYYSDGTIQHGGLVLGIGGVAGHIYRHFPGDHPGYFNRLLVAQNYSAVTAACLLVRKEIFDKVGGLNEVDLTVALNDVDFCLKVRELGYRNLWTPYAELYHHESVSRGADDTPEKKRRFELEFAYMQRRWDGVLKTDPAYNRNLSMTREDFSLRR
jgi:GT2 family glycosyltransferase